MNGTAFAGKNCDGFHVGKSPSLLICGYHRQGFCRLHILFATLLQQLGDQSSPSSLVTGADASPRVTVEVLVERNQVSPVGVVLEVAGGAEHRAAAVVIAEENTAEPA